MTDARRKAYLRLLLAVLIGWAVWRIVHVLRAGFAPPPPAVVPVTPPVPALPAKKPPQAAIVIDDVGYQTVSMDRFASLGIPLTFAIFPREKHSKALSEKAASLHFPVMLHLPMEPLDLVHNDPGPSAL